MTKEHEHPVLTSQGRDNEIRSLCNKRAFYEAYVEGAPLGSCEWMLAKAYLRGLNERLEELGIHEVVFDLENGREEMIDAIHDEEQKKLAQLREELAKIRTS